MDALTKHPGQGGNVAPESIMQLGLGFWASKALLSAVELGLFTEKGGALIVYDQMIDDERRENASGLLMSLNMLVATHGGFDYTGAACVGWMHDAGFDDVRRAHLCAPYSMVVGIK
jgi:hypothetical protein